MVEVRPTTHDDAFAIGTVHAASWRVAYAHLGDAFIASVEDAERIALWERLVTEPNPIFVAAIDDNVVAFVLLSLSRDEDASPTTGEVIAIYAAPTAWGTGAGRALMDCAISELSAMGFATATLWVLADNDRARRFYEIAGWTPDGTSKHQTWRGVEVDEVRYRRSL